MKNPQRVYNNNSLSADTWAAAVIFTSPQWGNIDICKSTEGIRQGFLPPAVQGQWHAGSNQELCGSLLRMERIWRGRRIIPILPKQSRQRESRCGGWALILWTLKELESPGEAPSRNEWRFIANKAAWSGTAKRRRPYSRTGFGLSFIKGRPLDY